MAICADARRLEESFANAAALRYRQKWVSDNPNGMQRLRLISDPIVPQRRLLQEVYSSGKRPVLQDMMLHFMGAWELFALVIFAKPHNPGKY